ncbi:hypothetical protein Taro_014746 [Colocasia esculenta]|uniref:non-specific serine/threonine protein kinase n=1 Tax=Colocasia esculenta TaxID=4460 RepID=A0A843UFN9_COLES|nr:hypothetical protein [Colocasia esculenta]
MTSSWCRNQQKEEGCNSARLIASFPAYRCGRSSGGFPSRVRTTLSRYKMEPDLTHRFCCEVARQKSRTKLVRLESSNFSNAVSKDNDVSNVPLLDLNTVKAATSNFSSENKLGEGGFGPVYKGKLLSGDEIAVKRLSKLSKQGHQEFSNEVRLIAKLQHKNLVRLLGSCAHKDEKILIYEYMPNKSLDKFIFGLFIPFLLYLACGIVGYRFYTLMNAANPRRSAELTWQKRFGIIQGIANGLLYLHHYSRMRVIHRDLKTSNILLDSEMKPKISDFGLARIFRVDQMEANTGKVVGTFGYMSPEYASQGLFSEKSDVFSFGVIVLEIITGERSTSFYPHKNSQTLLGYVWQMWEEGRALELQDPSMGSSPTQAGEVLKCTQLGLLCVQQDAAERPTMSYVVSSLSNGACVLPKPRQPAFAIGGDPNATVSYYRASRASVNELTMSSVGGR